MEFLKLFLVVAAVALSTFPRFSHSMTLLYPVSASNDSIIIIGVGLVKDGDYGVVCDEGDTDTVNFLCSNLGEFDNDSYIIDPSVLNVSFVNYNCPSGFSSCGVAASIVSNCSTPLILDCDLSGCFPGQVQLTNSVNVSTDTGVAYVGYPEVCVNGNFIPICNETELGALELIFICAYQPINASISLIGNPYNAGLSPLMSTAPLSVTGYDCGTGTNNCAVSTGMNCTSDYVIVTCEEGIPSGVACDSNAYANGGFLFNNETTVSADGSIVTTGIYQSCPSGSYVRYCTYPSQWGYPSLVDIANGICISLGYSFGVIVPFENRFTQGSPPGISAIDINCSSIEGSECNYTLCDDTDRQMVLRCTRSPDCAVTGGYLYNNVTRMSNGREYTSGIFVNCESGVYLAICRTNGSDLSNLCSSGILGYEGGEMVSYNSTAHGALPFNTAYFTNLDCPSNATSVSECNATPFNSTECDNVLVLQCYRDIVTSTSTVTSTVLTSTVASSSTPPPPTSTPTSGANIGAIVGGSIAVVVAVITIVIVTIVVITVTMYVKKHRSPVVPISEKKSHPI